MKCSNCGSDNLKEVNMDVLLGISGDASLRSRGDTFICLECGHIDFFNTAYVEDIKIKLKKKQEIENQINEKNKRISELENQKFDPAPFIKRIKKLQEEIKTLESMNVGGKVIRSREDGIKDYQKILDNKKDPSVVSEINHLKCEIRELEKKYSEIDNPPGFFSFF